MKTFLHLENVIDKNKLQKIQDEFSEATGFAAITVDYRGKPVTTHSSCSNFCKMIREKASDLCEKCDSRGGFEAIQTGQPFIYKCHAGIVDFAAPIVVNGQYLGAIMGGQVITADDNAMLGKITEDTLDVGEDVKLIEAYIQIPIISYKKIKSVANMMFHIANTIAETGYINVMQEELHKQSIELIEAREAELKLENELKKSEIKTLHSQLNPQFLLKTLGTIGNLSYIEKANETVEITYTLIDLMKYVATNIFKKVTVEDEMNFIEKYLYIHKKRLGERLTFTIEVNDDTKKIMIPSFFLHPLVENAINEIETKEGQVVISVKVTLTKDHLMFTITNNSVGEIIEEAHLNIQQRKLSPTHHWIKQIFKEKYYETANLYVESDEKVGTITKVVLPCE